MRWCYPIANWRKQEKKKKQLKTKVRACCHKYNQLHVSAVRVHCVLRIVYKVWRSVERRSLNNLIENDHSGSAYSPPASMGSGHTQLNSTVSFYKPRLISQRRSIQITRRAKHTVDVSPKTTFTSLICFESDSQYELIKWIIGKQNVELSYLFYLHIITMFLSLPATSLLKLSTPRRRSSEAEVL